MAAALLLVALWLLTGDAAEEPEVADSMTAPPLVTEPEAVSWSHAPPVDEARTGMSTNDDRATATRTAADLRLPCAFELRVLVVDPLGLPVPEARVFVAPPCCALALWPDATDARGMVTIAVHGREAQLEVWFAVLAYGVAEPLRNARLDASSPRTCTVVARGQEHHPEALLDLIDAEHGDLETAVARAAERKGWMDQKTKPTPRAGRVRRRDDADTLCGRSLSLFARIDCGVCHAPTLVQCYAPFGSAVPMRAGLGYHRLFADLQPRTRGIDGSGPPEADAKTKPPRRERHRTDDLEAALSREVGAARMGSVTGTVRAENGAPQPGVLVAWRAADGVVRNRAETDAEGRYRIGLPASGACTLVAAGGGRGRDEALVAAVPSGVVQQDFTLHLRGFVHGFALDETGAPLAGARVEFSSDVEDGTGLGVTASDGSFALAQLPRSGRCLLWPKDADLRLPVLLSDSVLPDAEGVSLRLSADPPQRSRLRVEAKLPAGCEAARICVRLLQIDTGRGTHLESSPIAGGFRLEGLMAGPYRLELGAEGLGWVTLGPIHLDGRGLWDLGAVELPKPGSVRLSDVEGTPSPQSRKLDFRLQRQDTDILVEPQWLDATTAALPPGNYAVLWRTPDGKLRTAAIAVASGSEVALSLIP